MTKRRQLTLTEMVTSIVVIIITVLGLVIFVSIASSVGTMNTISQEKNIGREIEIIKEELTAYLDIVEIILNDTATTPIVTQAALQPEYSSGNLKDYLDDFKILNEQFNTSLLNINGERIYSNGIDFLKNYSTEAWAKELVSGALESYKSVTEIDSEYYWTVAVPVIYNGYPEGVLVAEIPINRGYGFNNISEQLQGIEIEILKDDVSVLRIGHVEEGLVKRGVLEHLDIDLKFIIDQSDSLEMIQNLKVRLLIIILSFIVIAVLILLVVSKRFIIKPITDLKKMIDVFMIEGRPNDDFPSASVVEINELSEQYHDMSKIIIQRENALKVSEQTQIRKNEKLEELVNKLESTQSLIIQQEKLASIGRLAAGVAHELNNPIGFVNGNFEMLSEYMPTLMGYVAYLKTGIIDPDIDLEDIDYILEDIPKLLVESEEGFIRIVDIVQNLKDYSRIDISKNDTYDINNGVRTTLMVAKNEYKDIASIDLELEKVPRVVANGSEINEVLLNLIVNSSQALAEYTGTEQKIISVATYTQDTYVCCDIKDNGPGIPTEIIGKIYDPFFTTKEPGKGTGLGLNIAYNIVKNKHNGDLTVTSEINKGTTFTIKLPTNEEE